MNGFTTKGTKNTKAKIAVLSFLPGCFPLFQICLN